MSYTLYASEGGSGPSGRDGRTEPASGSPTRHGRITRPGDRDHRLVVSHRRRSNRCGWFNERHPRASRERTSPPARRDAHAGIEPRRRIDRRSRQRKDGRHDVFFFRTGSLDWRCRLWREGFRHRPRRTLIETWALGRGHVAHWLVGIDGRVRIARRLHIDASHPGAEASDFVVGQIRRSCVRIDVDPPDVRRTRPVGVGGRHEKTYVDRIAVPDRRQLHRRCRQQDQRRQGRSGFTAGGGRRCNQQQRRDTRANDLLRAFVSSWQPWCLDRFHYRMYRDRSSFFTISASIRITYGSSITTRFSIRSGPSNEISSSSFSITVCSRRAPMFSVRSFTSVA